MINDIHDCIKTAHYFQGHVKTPCIQETNEIYNKLQTVFFSGLKTSVVGCLGIGLAYFVWQIPYAGPLLSVVSATAGVAANVLGYDKQAAAIDLKYRYIDGNPPCYCSEITNRHISEAEFEAEFSRHANKHTILKY